jgi:hypothetical protein
MLGWPLLSKAHRASVACRAAQALCQLSHLDPNQLFLSPAAEASSSALGAAGGRGAHRLRGH